MRKLTTEEFIEKAKLVHGNKYDYSLVEYNGCENKVEIICREHGSFFQNKLHHINRAQGCPVCSGNFLFTAKQFIEKARKVHGNKYDYSKVEYKNARSKIEIICPIHGKFFQIPCDHLSGNGCKLCGIKKALISRSYSIKQFIEKAIEIHSNKYIYNDYSKSSKKIKIFCKKCKRYFFQTPNNHISKQYGCPLCSSSKGENKIISYLKENYIEFIKEKKFDNCINPRTGYNLKYDFYLPKQNLLVEYDGIQHFIPVKAFGGKNDFNKRVFKDNIKNNYANDNDINLLRIPHTDFNNIKEILNRKIKCQEN